MNYKESREYLIEINKYGSVLGLESITKLLDSIGNPQEQLKVVHIAGTNGKGSISAFLQNVMVEAGYVVGRYSSPAVFDCDEIIQINGKNIEHEQLANIITIIKEKAERILQDCGFHPTPFEIETAMAFEYFKRKECDVVLVECGMGGESDATNVFQEVLCSVIASISLDHTAFLGDTIEEIAKIKAGIIKKNCPVIVSHQDEKVMAVIKNIASKNKAELIKAGVARISFDDSKNRMSYTATNGKIYETDIQMFGTYQRINIATAIEVVLCLEKQGFYLEKYMESGLAKASWKGRMEIISENPLFIIDGAHNPGAMKELRDSIDLYFTNKRITFIMGVLADKDFRLETEIIADRAENIITVTPRNQRALSGKKLEETIRQYNDNVHYAETIESGVKQAIDSVKNKQSDMIIAFGSLSHLGDIKQAVKAERRD